MRYSRLHIASFLAVSIAFWALMLIVQGTPITWNYLTPFGATVSFLVILLLTFDRFLWRWPWLHWFVKRPNLRGTWCVEIKSDWISPGANQDAPSMIKGYIGVEQTLSRLQMQLMTAESNSVFIANVVIASPNMSGYQIAGIYTNKPRVHLRPEKSAIHQGALILETHGPLARPHTLTGEYWTDRKTTGSMVLTSCVRSIFTRFDDADKHFNKILTK